MNKTLTIIIPRMNLSGVSITAQQVANYLSKQNIEINFVVLNGTAEHSALNQDVSVRLLSPRPPKHKIIAILMSIFHLAMYLVKNKPHHVMIWGKEYAVIAALLKKTFFLKTKIMGVNANSITRHINQSRAPWRQIKTLAYTLFLKMCDQWIAQSEGVRGEMIADYSIPPHKVSVVYPAINTQFFKGATEKKQNEILFIGRLEQQKNPLLMIALSAPFLKQNPDYTLRVLGDGPLLEKMRVATRQANIDNQVIFEGFVTDTKPFLAKAKALILTSDFEGFGMVLVESIAMGVPVVSLDCPFGPREIIKNDINGYLVQSQSDFASRLDQATLQKEWDRNQMIESIQTFHPDLVLKNYYQTLSEWLKNGI